MNKLLGILVSCIFLSGCYTTGTTGYTEYPTKFYASVKHVDNEKTYENYGSIDASKTSSGALKKCTSENRSNPEGCLLFFLEITYNNGKTSRINYWDGQLANYKIKKNKKVAKKPKKQEPKKQEPKKQEPKKQEPKKQEPKKQEPKKQKPKKQTPELDDNKIVAASSGTGFYVSNTGHIISNHHVIDGCNTVKLTFQGKEFAANILASDKMNDLAILKADLTPSKVYSISTEDAMLLEDIIIAGYPLGKKVSAAIKTSKGSITALAGYGDNYSEFQTDAALNQGNSGGPIMNQKGNVVGVAVANYGKQSGVESFNFGIKSSTLKTFASANGLKFLPPNNRDLSNKDLGQLITEATIYLECHMTVAKIKRMIAEEKNRKAFFSKYK